jgi:hypothetical protein
MEILLRLPGCDSCLNPWAVLMVLSAFCHWVCMFYSPCAFNLFQLSMQKLQRAVVSVLGRAMCIWQYLACVDILQQSQGVQVAAPFVLFALTLLCPAAAYDSMT